MSLIVEDGTGISGAESYASTAYVDAYWTARPQLAAAALWSAADAAHKEGACREATAYVDGTWGNYFRGYRRGWVQGLLWPRSEALDDARGPKGVGYPLPDLPECIKIAVAELAGRAIATPLAKDLARGGLIKAVKAGSVDIQYADGAPARPTYGVVAMILAPVLNGSQPDAPNGQWGWR